MVQNNPYAENQGADIHPHRPKPDVFDCGRVHLAYDHPRDIAGIAEVLALDVYQTGRLRKGDLVLDVGAGIGDFAVLAARAVGRDGSVVAIEPNPTDFALMCANVLRNSLTNVWPINCAVGPDGQATTLVYKEATFEATQRSLARVLEELRSANPRLSRAVDFVKMDVEGAEPAALATLGRELSQVRVVAIELHGTQVAVDGILNPLGFRFFPLSRAAYLTNATGFAMRHPIASIALWRLLKRRLQRPQLSKIIRGIEISRGERLTVGIYARP